MKTIDLKNIVESRNLDINEIAVQLFPSNKYPRLAFNRVVSGQSHLDSQQISKLSMITGLSISELFSSGPWEMSSNKNILKFQNDDFSAELDLKSNTTKVYHKKSLIHEEIIHTKSIVLSEYIDKLNSIVTNKN